MNDAAEQIEPEVIEQPEAVEAEQTEEITEEETEATAEETEEQPPESSTEKEDSQGKNKVQERIDELTRLRREAERDRDYWRTQAQDKKEPEPVKPPENLKTLADFDYDEAQYHTYLFNEVTKASVDAARQEIEATSQHQSANERLRTFMSAEDQFSAEHKDYMEVTRDPSLAYTKDMHEIVTSLDKGVDVMYYLAKNPDISDKIARMSGARQAVELGRIEERITHQSKKPEQVTKAPEPTPKIKSKGQVKTITADSADSDKLSMDEWLKRRNKQVRG